MGTEDCSFLQLRVKARPSWSKNCPYLSSKCSTSLPALQYSLRSRVSEWVFSDVACVLVRSGSFVCRINRAASRESSQGVRIERESESLFVWEMEGWPNWPNLAVGFFS